MAHKIALIGFGTVGQGLCEILLDKADALRTDHGFEVQVVAVSDLMKGAASHPDGLDLAQLLEFAKNDRSLDELPGAATTGQDALTTIRECNADTVCELAYTDIKTGQPAIDHCRAAFAAGRNVVTSNKGPAALKYRDLVAEATAHGARFMIEGTVMSGTPVLNLARHTLAGTEISAIKGILNGTTNYILTKMEEGEAYEAVLRKAQELGYAEADPTADVEGLDALAKVTILANVLMGENLTPDAIPCEGISKITLDDIERARSQGKRYKLIGEIRRDGNEVEASVKPMMVDLAHPLAGVSGAVNAVTFSTDLMGDVTVSGAGAGRTETGYSILVDLLDLHHSKG